MVMVFVLFSSSHLVIDIPDSLDCFGMVLVRNRLVNSRPPHNLFSMLKLKPNNMYRLFATLVLVLVLALAVSESAAFTTTTAGYTKALGATRVISSTTSGTPIAFSTTKTSLNLKVDPNKKQEERINPAVFKNGLYLGSIAFAVLLPLALLLAASK
eukprot:scaffold8690_cov190-Amphora_coffeaeformis.AAC.16